MNQFKQVYLPILSAVFVVGLILGAILFSLFSENCKTREQLCSLDIKQNITLQQTLKKQELLCTEKIDSIVKETLKQNNLKFNLKFQRLQDACNRLDCAQCKR